MSINLPTDSLADMAVFARVVELGSFSSVARESGRTPSAVSRQVARLEQVLRVRLLERTTRQMRLTEAGRQAHAQCQALVGAAREVLALRDSQHTRPQGLLRVSMAKAIGRQLVHPLMPAFLRAHPGVDVQLLITDRQVDLLAESIDLAIRVTDAPPPGLAGRPWRALPHGLFASPAYLAERDLPAQPAELAQHDCIPLGETPADCHWRFVRGAEHARVAVRGRYIANHTEVRLDAALLGFGIASLPWFTAEAAVRRGELRVVLPDWEHPTDYAGMAWLLYPSHRFLPAKLRVWIDHLVAQGSANSESMR
jgi:DNA-binding transcriptional LysR family regulator